MEWFLCFVGQIQSTNNGTSETLAPAEGIVWMVTDAFGKTETGQVSIPEPAPIEVELVSPLYPNGNHVSCYDCYNGSITANVTGGTGTYSYDWKEVPGVNAATVTGLNAGHYRMTVFDQNDCASSNKIDLKMPQREDWTMNGNAGTDPSTQFIGTTDSVDVVFKSNNAEALRIAANGRIGIGGITTPTESIETNGNIKSNGFVLGNGLMQRIGSGNAGTFYFDPDGT